MTQLGFKIEKRSGIDVLIWDEGGCRPAFDTEIALWQQVNALAVLAGERRVFIVNGAEMGYIQLPVFDEDPAKGTYERCLLKTEFAADAIKRQWMAEGVEASINHLMNKFEGTGHIGVPVMALASLAAQLHAQGPVNEQD